MSNTSGVPVLQFGTAQDDFLRFNRSFVRALVARRLV
eukprot:SAG31_NODE_15458_length_754_cov_0.975573_2_plen_36_part_01